MPLTWTLVIPLMRFVFLSIAFFKVLRFRGNMTKLNKFLVRKATVMRSAAEGRSPERGTLPSARVHCDASDIAGKRPSAIA
jgi:hypothetical protein